MPDLSCCRILLLSCWKYSSCQHCHGQHYKLVVTAAIVSRTTYWPVVCELPLFAGFDAGVGLVFRAARFVAAPATRVCALFPCPPHPQCRPPYLCRLVASVLLSVKSSPRL